MDIIKHERARDILKRVVAEFIARTSNRRSLITLTNFEITDNEKDATIQISVLPNTHEQAAIDFLTRNLTELRSYVREHTVLRTIPYFKVEIDRGEKNRQHIEELIEQAKAPATPRPKRKKKVS